MDCCAIYGGSRWGAGEQEEVGRPQMLAGEGGRALVRDALVQASKLVDGRIASRTSTSASQTLGQPLTSLKNLRFGTVASTVPKPRI